MTAGLLLAAAGVGTLASVAPGGGYSRVLLALILAGSGIGMAMAPATDSVMGSLPLAKASVGSATNDTSGWSGERSASPFWEPSSPRCTPTA